MTLTLDTNAYSAFKAGDGVVRRLLEEAEQVIVPVVVIGELMAGFMQGNRLTLNTAELDEFLRQAGIVVHDISVADANRYASLIKGLRVAGTRVPVNDVWIAAVALAEGCRVLTKDAHFQKLPGIVPIAW